MFLQGLFWGSVKGALRRPRGTPMLGGLSQFCDLEADELRPRLGGRENVLHIVGRQKPGTTAKIFERVQVLLKLAGPRIRSSGNPARVRESGRLCKSFQRTERRGQRLLAVGRATNETLPLSQPSNQKLGPGARGPERPENLNF
eukprot:9162562-Pyramimonas_sp.AAC.1